MRGESVSLNSGKARMLSAFCKNRMGGEASGRCSAAVEMELVDV